MKSDEFLCLSLSAPAGSCCTCAGRRATLPEPDTCPTVTSSQALILKLISTLGSSSGKGEPLSSFTAHEIHVIMHLVALMACPYQTVNWLITSRVLFPEGSRLLSYTRWGFISMSVLPGWYSFCICIILTSGSLLCHTQLCPWAEIVCYFPEEMLCSQSLTSPEKSFWIPGLEYLAFASVTWYAMWMVLCTGIGSAPWCWLLERLFCVIIWITYPCCPSPADLRSLAEMA